MTQDSAALSRRHALLLTLVYLVVRAIPDIALWGWPLWSEGMRLFLHVYVFPKAFLPMDLFLLVPLDFQRMMSTGAVLLLEGLMVFLCSVWLLRNRAGALRSGNRRLAWVVMVVATIAWSMVLRHLVMQWVVGLQTGPSREMDYDQINRHMLAAYWKTIPVFYLTPLVWALVPVWLHVRTLARGAQSESALEASTLTPPVQRSASLASFLMGFCLLHFTFVLLVYMGLWPLMSMKENLMLSIEELRSLGRMLILNQFVLGTLVGALAGYLFVRERKEQGLTFLRLLGGPLLSGSLAVIMASLASLFLVWMTAFLAPGVISALLRRLTTDPAASTWTLVGFNLLGLAALCGLSMLLGRAQRPASADSSSVAG